MQLFIEVHMHRNVAIMHEQFYRSLLVYRFIVVCLLYFVCFTDNLSLVLNQLKTLTYWWKNILMIVQFYTNDEAD
jgi:hypothetical protein